MGMAAGKEKCWTVSDFVNTGVLAFCVMRSWQAGRVQLRLMTDHLVTSSSGLFFQIYDKMLAAVSINTVVTALF